jgi:hypothetical protein
LIDLPEVSKHWHRHKMTAAEAREYLRKLISLRGDIVHRVASASSIKKDHVTNGVELTTTLARITSNRVRDHVKSLVDTNPWPEVAEPPKPGPAKK